MKTNYTRSVTQLQSSKKHPIKLSPKYSRSVAYALWRKHLLPTDQIPGEIVDRLLAPGYLCGLNADIESGVAA